MNFVDEFKFVSRKTEYERNWGGLLYIQIFFPPFCLSSFFTTCYSISIIYIFQPKSVCSKVLGRTVTKYLCSKDINPLTPNDPYRGRTAPLTSKFAFFYIYSTNIGTEYFKHGIYSPFFPIQNAFCFIILTYLVPVLFTFYIQGVLKLKDISGAKRFTNFSIFTYS